MPTCKSCVRSLFAYPVDDVINMRELEVGDRSLSVEPIEDTLIAHKWPLYRGFEFHHG